MSLSRILWACVMLVRAKNRLRNAAGNVKDYEAALKNDKACLDYYLAEQPKRRMDLILAEIEYDVALGRKRGAQKGA